MSVKEILLTVLSAALMDNLVFTQFLGISSIGTSEKGKYLGPAAAAIMLITAAICTPVSALLRSAGLEAYNIMAFTVIILAVCSALERWLGKRLKLSFLLMALNSAVLGLAVNSAAACSGLAAAALTALGAGLGFRLALILMSSLQLKLNNPDIPRPFRGFPIQLLAAGIISMAVLAF